MAATFKALAKNAEFGPPSKSLVRTEVQTGNRYELGQAGAVGPPAKVVDKQVQLGGLIYSIQIHLPESRDPAVYDALFRSLKEHLLK